MTSVHIYSRTSAIKHLACSVITTAATCTAVINKGGVLLKNGEILDLGLCCGKHKMCYCRLW